MSLTGFFLASVLLAASTPGAHAGQGQAAGTRAVMSEEATRLLAELRQRLDDFAAASRQGQGLERGGDLDLRPLTGLGREMLSAVLGPTSIDCRARPAANMRNGEPVRLAPCETDEDLAYLFYALPNAWRGGGPALLLQFDRGGFCTLAVWRRVQ